MRLFPAQKTINVRMYTQTHTHAVLISNFFFIVFRTFIQLHFAINDENKNKKQNKTKEKHSTEIQYSLRVFFFSFLVSSLVVVLALAYVFLRCGASWIRNKFQNKFDRLCVDRNEFSIFDFRQFRRSVCRLMKMMTMMMIEMCVCVFEP